MPRSTLLLLAFTALCSGCAISYLDPLQDPKVQKELEGDYLFVVPQDTEYYSEELIRESMRHFGAMTGIRPVDFRILKERETYKATASHTPTVVLGWSSSYDPKMAYYSHTDKPDLELELTIYSANGDKFVKKASCAISWQEHEFYREVRPKMFMLCFFKLLYPWWHK